MQYKMKKLQKINWSFQGILILGLKIITPLFSQTKNESPTYC